MSGTAAFFLSVALVLGGKSQTLKTWSTAQELSSLKHVSSSEKDPASGQVLAWYGVTLSSVLDQALADVPLDQKARFDLIVLKGAHGDAAFVPRSVIQKYPVLLARKKDRANQELTEGMEVVIPWTSKPKIKSEEYLPLERYFVRDLKTIELASYSERYASVQLKRRTDPSAMRGEKIFIQNCLGCHGTGAEPYSNVVTQLSAGAARALATTDKTLGHPKVPGMKEFKDRDRRAIMSFLEAFQAENPIGK